jgi:hypothetical protein
VRPSDNVSCGMPRTISLPPVGRCSYTLCWISLFLWTTGAMASDPNLGNGQYRLVGAAFDIQPARQIIPVGVPATIQTVFSGPVAGLITSGARVAADLSGPGLTAPVTLSTVPGGALVVPALSVQGEYHLSDIRLTQGGRTVAQAAHPAATVVVTDILVTQITSRALTSQDLASRGITVNDSSFKAFSFAFGLVIQGKTIRIELPTCIQSGSTFLPIGPPNVQIDEKDERFTPPTVLPVQLQVDTLPSGGAPDAELIDEGSVTPPPVFGILVFPGNIRFLNQFFSVILLVQNGSATGSGLSLSNVTTTITLPSLALRLSQTTPSVPSGQQVPVRNEGPDGVLGTGDDISVLVAQQTGQAEFVTEGLRVGTHEVVCDIEASVIGLAGGQPLRLKGTARGSVLVRDPSFSLTFNHPDVVREGEEYEIRATVVNTSTVRANQVTLSIDAASVTGATSLDAAPGIDPAVALGDITAGESADARFRFQATRTGRVVASSFTSDGSVVGALRLRAGVTNDGTPLSPDTFIFPKSISILPAAVVDPATALIGIAHGLATQDPTAGLGSDEPPFANGVVQDRVVDLVQAARRASLGEPIPSAVADLAFGWLGSSAVIPAFDAVRRANRHGQDMESGIGQVLTELNRSGGTAALGSTLMDALAASGGSAFVLLQAGDPSDPVARLALVDYKTGAASRRGAGETGYSRDLPFASILPITSSGGGEVGLLGRLGEQGFSVVVEGRQTGTFSLQVVFPDGKGGYRSAVFVSRPTGPNETAVLRVQAGATDLYLSNPTHGITTVTSQPAVPSAFAPIVAVQDLDANSLGKVATFVFNRSTGEGAADLRLYRLPTILPSNASRERGIQLVQVGSDPRLVSIVSTEILSPYRPGSAAGAAVSSAAGESWTGEIPLQARLAVAGGSLEGRVLGPDGTPLSNAPVQISESSTDDLSGETFAASTTVVTTDVTGTFFVEFVRKQDGRPFRIDSFDAITGSKGYAVGSIHTNGEVVHVDVVLQGRGTVRGMVTDGKGVPLAKAIVRCASTTDSSFRTAQYSAADGTFVFSSVPVGTVQLQAEDPATRQLAAATALLGAPGGTVRTQLVLTSMPRTSVAGTVLHGANSKPYPGLYVAAYSPAAAGDGYDGVRTTGADGIFSFSSIPAGDVRFEVFDASISRYPVLVQGVTLQADQPVSLQLVVPETVKQYGTVQGTVRINVSGAVVPAAATVVYLNDSGLRTTTGTDGTYRLDGVPVGTVRVTAFIPSSGRSVSTDATVQNGLTSVADLLFPGTSTLGTVTGTVVDQSGAPRADAAVEIWDADPPLKLISSARSAGNGTFTLTDVPIGTSRIQATSPETRAGRVIRNAGAVSATILSAGGSASVTIALRGFVDITGRVIARVRDVNGNLHDNPVFAPVQLASARFDGSLPSDPAADPTNPEDGRIFEDGPGLYATVSTDPSTGTFSFQAAHGGRLTVTAKNAFYGDKTFDFGTVLGDTSRGPIDLLFDGNLGTVDGFLYDSAGTPLAVQPVTLEVGWKDPLQAVTHPDGYFVFPLVPFAQQLHAKFEAQVAGVSRFAEAYGSVTAASPNSRLTLRVIPVGSVTVAVKDDPSAGGTPISGAQVVVEETAGSRRKFTATTDGTGTVSFPSVTAGSIAVAAKMDLRSGRTSLLGVGEGFRVEGIVTFGAFGSVTGTVRSPADGSGIPGANVVLSTWGGGFSGDALGAATTGSDGSFLIEDVPAGSGFVHSLSVVDPRTSRNGASASFSIATGESRQVDVTLRAIGSVFGTLRTFDGSSPIPGTSLRISSAPDVGSSSPTLTVTTGQDGTYRADGVPAGTITVDASQAGAGLSARGTGRLTAEGQAIQVDLYATPTGRIQGSVFRSDGSALPADAVAPEVRVQFGFTGLYEQVALASTYDFENVVAGTFSLRGTERVSPFHLAQADGQLAAGEPKQVDLRYGPFGTVRVHVRKPDPTQAGSEPTPSWWTL